MDYQKGMEENSLENSGFQQQNIEENGNVADSRVTQEGNSNATNSASDSESETEESAAVDKPSESTVVPADMDLSKSIEETIIALNLFLNNKFNEAKARMQPWADRSMYHALGYGTIMYLQAAMTFEAVDIEAAIETVKRSIHVCNKQRKKISVMGSFSRSSKRDYSDYTEEQIHAELCYAECLIERALLTFVQDENLISFVKGGLKIRACYQSYKECLKMLQQRSWNGHKEHVHFESGVRMGIGAFNLLISLLPTKVLKLLEFVGFSGNKKIGLRELEEGSNNLHGLRGPLCSLFLLGYHTVVTYVLGTADGDIDLAERILQPCLQNYPKGALFLFFAGRIEEIKGNIEEAIVRFEESCDSQQEWRQFHHLCFWELMWCHSFKCDWLMAMKYAERLCRESRWSKATYTYQKASFLLMCEDKTPETVDHINYLFGEVPALKQRIAGKSIPIEKFAVKKAKRYQTQKNRLVLPALELIYVWNGFSIIGKKPALVEPMLTVIEATVNEILNNKDVYHFFVDDYCLALHLKGVCLKYVGRLFQAEMCFKEVCENERKLKHDNYLVPWAYMELALLRIQQDELDEAKSLLDKSKHFKGFSLESRLHFRIHAANILLKSLQNKNLSSQFAGANSDDPGTPDEPLADEFGDVPSDTSPISSEASSPGIPVKGLPRETPVLNSSEQEVNL